MFQNMRYAPFLKMYESILSSMDNVNYEVVYFDRDELLEEPKDDSYIAIKWRGKGTLAASKSEKMVNFLFYKHDVQELLKKKRYDFLIILTTFPAVLLSGFLRKNYAGRYIIDIRDYTQERFKTYFKIEEKVFSEAALLIISSPGFVNFLPKFKYYICHNIDDNVENIVRPDFKRVLGRRIVVSYIGSISYETQCKQLIDLVDKDDRFEFHFYGNEANGTVVSEYIKKLNNPRIIMFGEFTPDEKEKIYSKSDLVFNCYGNDRMLVKYAISNKFYDGAIYRKPLLVSPDTSMAEFSKPFAYPLDLENIGNLDMLYKWYYEINEKKYIEYANQIIKMAITDNDKLRISIKKCINK